MGPTQRELVTPSAALDWLLKGHPARAADLLSQRLKSIESVLGGAHWSVAQRMEIAPAGGPLSCSSTGVVGGSKRRLCGVECEALGGLARRSQGQGQVDSEPHKGKGKSKSSNKGDKAKAKEDSACRVRGTMMVGWILLLWRL